MMHITNKVGAKPIGGLENSFGKYLFLQPFLMIFTGTIIFHSQLVCQRKRHYRGYIDNS